ncbi:ArsR/SmtB family transcription factor [Kocuria oceani]|uniref:ArsR/SmtB family transcription factor n=1 Tax=Kocuria oceani TaxID=988827 RepID=UPI0040367180
MPTTPSARVIAHPAREKITLEAVLAALADPVRLRIVGDLAAGHTEMACVSFRLPVTKSTATHHFRVLREAGLIRQSYQGTSRMNALRRDDLEALFPGLLDTILAVARQHGSPPLRP